MQLLIKEKRRNFNTFNTISNCILTIGISQYNAALLSQKPLLPDSTVLSICVLNKKAVSTLKLEDITVYVREIDIWLLNSKSRFSQKSLFD